MTQKIYKRERERDRKREREMVKSNRKHVKKFYAFFCLFVCLKGTTNVMPFQFNFMLRVSTVKYNVMELV